MSQDLFAGHQFQMGTIEAVKHGKYVYNLAKNTGVQEITDAHCFLAIEMFGFHGSVHCTERLPSSSVYARIQ